MLPKQVSVLKKIIMLLISAVTCAHNAVTLCMRSAPSAYERALYDRARSQAPMQQAPAWYQRHNNITARHKPNPTVAKPLDTRLYLKNKFINARNAVWNKRHTITPLITAAIALYVLFKQPAENNGALPPDNGARAPHQGPENNGVLPVDAQRQPGASPAPARSVSQSAAQLRSIAGVDRLGRNNTPVWGSNNHAAASKKPKRRNPVHQPAASAAAVAELPVITEAERKAEQAKIKEGMARHAAHQQTPAAKAEQARLKRELAADLENAKQPLAKLEIRRLRAPQQHEEGSCGLRAIVSAAVIEESLAHTQQVPDTLSPRDHERLFEQGRQALQTRQREHTIKNGLGNSDIMLLARQTFGMDNCCLIFRKKNQCQTTLQSEQSLAHNHIDETGSVALNGSIKQMLRNLRKKPYGAIHFIFSMAFKQNSHNNQQQMARRNTPSERDANNDSDGDGTNHWILISAIKQGLKKRTLYYTDSNNSPLERQPDAQKCIDYLKSQLGTEII